jgi:DNA recombination protein RmuC
MSNALPIVTLLLSLISLVASVLTLLGLRAWRAEQEAEGTTEAISEVHAKLEGLRGEVQRVESSTREAATVQRQELAGQLTTARQEQASAADRAAKSLGESLNAQVNILTNSLTKATSAQTDAVERLRADVSQRLEASAKSQAETTNALRDELNRQLSTTRTEITAEVKKMSEANTATLNGISDRVSNQLGGQTQTIGASLDKVRTEVESKLKDIQENNGRKLDEMRTTVDEKLSSTLSTRLSESFKQVGDRLLEVQNGLGEMKNLTDNVSNLNRLMTNVKTRGAWGEVQLANLLEQIFAQGQYEANFKPRPRSGEVVEFAIRLPGAEPGATVFLPVDSKFPIEDFQRLNDAAEQGDADGVKASRKALENRIYECAKQIRDKYIAPPTTTNFAVLFLPTEALHAEVLRMPGLLESITRDYKVIVQGPATFAAFAMALLMGFRTLAIQKRSADIANLLGAVKNDFGKFSDLLGKVEEKLDDAKTNIGKARQRSTQIVKKLGKVEELPHEQATLLLPDPSSDPDAIVTDDQD